MATREKRSAEIGGWTFTLELPSVATARKIYDKLKLVLAIYASEKEEGDILGGPVSAAAPAGELIKAEDLEYLVKVFGELTQVSRVLDTVDGVDVPDIYVLSRAEHCDVVFSTNFELQFSWLDWCVKETFGGMIEKTRAASAELQKKRAREEAAKGSPGPKV